MAPTRDNRAMSTIGIAGPRPWPRAALWLSGLGMLFFASYNTANWLASQRAQVPSIVFAWESLIPYWPWTIVPYWSIDLFYALSLFVCATRRELDTHALRLLAAQVISVTVFIAAPLRCTWVRPETGGFYGALLDALLAFDKPFNQAPALHISLLVILWVCYARHLQGAWRWLLHGWFTLIGISVLTTYQHHFFDVPAGIWAGLLCLWLFPDHAASPWRGAAFTRDARRRQLALRYFSGAVVVSALSIVSGGWALWLLWIAASLLLVAMIYAGLGANAFQKNTAGGMSLASHWLLAPYLLGAWLNSRWWTRRDAGAAPVTHGVWIGRMPGRAADLPGDVRGLLDVCAELPCPASVRHYLHVPMLDLVPPTARQLAQAAQGIARLLAAGPVLVCCALGYSRSAAAIAAWLIISGKVATVDEAVARVLGARPGVVFTDAQRRALAQLAAEPR